MQDNLIICNHLCNAGCVHCIYSFTDHSAILSKTPLAQIHNTKSNLVILSGGEPFELDPDEFKKYIAMCIVANKYFKIATGGHVPIERYLLLFAKTYLFTGLQISTDVLSTLRNKNYKKHRETWIENINSIHRHQVAYSITITLSTSLNLKTILEPIKFSKPSYIMLNYLNKHAYDYKAQLTKIKKYFPEQPIIDGYTD